MPERRNLIARRTFLGGAGLLAPGLRAGTAPPGFRRIFDGRSLNGWHPIARGGRASNPPTPFSEAQRTSLGHWEVRDGILYGGQEPRRLTKPETGEDFGFGGYLITDDTYRDFELLVDANPEWPCDTGILVRMTPRGQGFQILLDHRGDDTHGIGGSIGFVYLKAIGDFRVDPNNFRWSVGPDGRPCDVKLVPGSDGVSKTKYSVNSEDFRRAWRFNDWNTFRVRVTGDLPCITTWINDVKVCECDIPSIVHPDFHPEAIQKTLGARGHIGFEVHDGPPWRWGVGKVSRWRNAYLREM